MKVTGTNAKMFMGDIEIGKIESWEISGMKSPIPEDVVSFDGIYDPEGMDILKAMVADGRTEFIAFIYSPIGEEHEARFRIIVDVDGQPSIEPIDEEIRELIKGWMI